MEGKVVMRINVLPEVIRKVSTKEIVVPAQWFSRKFPEVYFGKVGEKKIIFAAGWKVDSRILDDGTHLISRTAIDVFFAEAEEYKRFIVYQEKEGKTEYTDDISNIPSTAKVIPVRKILSLMEEKILETIATQLFE